MAKRVKNQSAGEASQEVAVQQESQAQVAKVSDTYPLQVIDLNNGLIPDLEGAKQIPIDLMADYWSPETIGEFKNVYFDCLKERAVQDFNDPEVTVMLTCAFFFEKESGKAARSISNGSKRLVGLMENLGVKRGTPLRITYLGKRKNTKNNFQSDIWSVQPLILDIK